VSGEYATGSAKRSSRSESHRGPSRPTGLNLRASDSNQRPFVEAFESQFALLGASSERLGEAKAIIEPVISPAAAEVRTDADLELLQPNVDRSRLTDV
jgi:DNA-binding FadR family transcriptional regulator